MPEQRPHVAVDNHNGQHDAMKMGTRMMMRSRMFTWSGVLSTTSLPRLPRRTKSGREERRENVSPGKHNDVIQLPIMNIERSKSGLP